MARVMARCVVGLSRGVVFGISLASGPGPVPSVRQDARRCRTLMLDCETALAGPGPSRRIPRHCAKPPGRM